MNSKTISNIAIFEEIIVIIATLIILYIKTYNVYDISWMAVLYPIFTAVAVNVGLLILSFILMIIGAFNSKNYEEYEGSNEERE